MRAPEPDHTHETSRTRRQRDAKPRPGQVGINDGRPDHHVVFASRRDALMPRAPIVWRERSDYSPRPAESYHRLRLQPCRCLRTHTHTRRSMIRPWGTTSAALGFVLLISTISMVRIRHTSQPGCLCTGTKVLSHAYNFVSTYNGHLNTLARDQNCKTHEGPERSIT